MQNHVRSVRMAARWCAALFVLAGLLLPAFSPVAHAQDDTLEANKALVTRYFEEVVNDQNFDVIDELYAPGYIEHFAGEDTIYADLEDLKQTESDFVDMMKLSGVTIDDMVAEGDRVVTRLTLSMMDGDLPLTSIRISRIEDGKIVESWENGDELAAMMAMNMVAPVDATLETNKAAMRRIVEEVINQQNLDGVEELYAPDFVEHRAFPEDFVATSYDDIRADLANLGGSQVEIQDLIAEGDLVTVRFSMTPYEGAEPVSGAYLGRFEDGKLAEAWDYTDNLNLFAQLGMIELPQLPETIAGGFNSPQGVLVDPDGNVWVIDSGTGGDQTAEWVDPGTGSVGSAMMGDTARIVRIAPDGTQTEVATLPSISVGMDTLGGARLALLDGELYATSGQWLGDLGPDRMDLAAAVVHVAADGTVEEVGNTWDLEEADNPGSFVVDSHPYGLAAGPDGRLWVADAGGNTLLAVDPATGEVTLQAVFDGIPGPMPNPERDNAMEMDPVPTGIVFDADGTAYVSLLSGFPFIPGSAKVMMVDADGNVADYATGLTMLTDLRMGPDDNLYAVQFGVFGEQGPTPNSGAIIRVLEGDASEVVMDGLSFPTSIDFDADGNAYVTVNGQGAPGTGEVVKMQGLVDMPGMPVADTMPGAAKP